MALVYTQQFNEPLSGADANPINPALWTTAVGSIPLQQLSHFIVCSTAAFACSANYTGITWHANSYIDFTLANAINNTDLECVLRSSADQNECYVFYVDSFGDGTADSAIVSYVGGSPTEILDFGTIPFSNGDSFRFGVFGTTLYAFQNDFLLGSVDDTDHASGFGGLFLTDSGGLGADVTDLQVSAFAGGMITDGPPPPSVYSVPDCRNYGNFPNDSRDVQATLTYDVPSIFSLRWWFDTLFNRTEPLPVDSRAAGEPTDSRVLSIIPVNSRTPGTYGPGE